LCKFKGVGKAKSITIIAALELGRRHKNELPEEKARIVESKAGYDYIVQELQDLDHEQFWIILLNRTNFIIGKQLVSRGGHSGTVVDPKVIFKVALDRKAHGMILCHNHPSGSTKPSQTDISLTKRLVDAGKLLEISVLDHLIIADKKYYSFADEGLI
jgi:DNA repair protein RadC